MSDTSRPWYTPETHVGDNARDSSATANEVAVEAIEEHVADRSEHVADRSEHVADRSEDLADRSEAASGEPSASDDFDRDRVLRLLDQLEADVSAVEAAMVHAESGDSEAFAAAVASLEPPIHAG
jgi:hypothetical protein